MTTSGIKWKEFKADLKEKYFDETLTDEELKARTERAKACRAKLQLLHTSGSMSHASARHNLGEELGRPARRDEVFVKTYTRKNGVPSRQAAPKIDEIKEVLEAYLELMDKTIQQGDAYAVVCGLKEPKGCVRVLGLGPTPQEIGTPGLKSYMPTRIQMEAPRS
ncbi:uncharacterized protein C2845_PM06G26040 [Panicum miliaceum]|uniref:Transposon protein, putative, CACTA, En/Spm sub-class n=1 Tax=Panicum miliaceum TaxID=4540 RepID=A0A3L6R9J9_PANMI|nr:uncharacterized protein C2845_PM06G26040 [Panicum miliaceum]